MKKLLIGFIAGVIVVGFSVLLSGCNHHDRTKAEIYFIEHDAGELECDDTCELPHEHHHGHHEHHDDD